MSNEQGFGAPQGDYGQGAPGYGYPQQSGPGYGYPQQPPPPAAGYGYPQGGAPQGGGAMLVSIGDIAVMNDSIMTPAGPMPLRGAIWTVTDMSRTEEKMPAYAVVLAIIFFLACLLGLLFLLIKERTTTGHVQVTVNSGGRHHSTMIPVSNPQLVAHIMGQVNYARSLSA